MTRWLTPTAQIERRPQRLIEIILLAELRRRRILLPPPRVIELVVHRARAAAARVTWRALAGDLSATQGEALETLFSAAPGQAGLSRLAWLRQFPTAPGARPDAVRPCRSRYERPARPPQGDRGAPGSPRSPARSCPPLRPAGAARASQETESQASAGGSRPDNAGSRRVAPKSGDRPPAYLREELEAQEGRGVHRGGTGDQDPPRNRLRHAWSRMKPGRPETTAITPVLAASSRQTAGGFCRSALPALWKARGCLLMFL